MRTYLLGVLSLMLLMPLAGCEDGLSALVGPQADLTLGAQAKGSLAVWLRRLDAARQTQARVSDVDHVEILIKVGEATQAQSLSREDLHRHFSDAARGAVTFDGLPPGTGTAVMTAFDASGNRLGSSTVPVTVKPNQKNNLFLNLRLDPTYVDLTGQPNDLFLSVGIGDGPEIKGYGPQPELPTRQASTLVLSEQLLGPTGLVADGLGGLYVSDTGHHRILYVSPEGTCRVFAGSGRPGWADGSGTTAAFLKPQGLALDAAGNLYVADRDNNCIRQVTPSGGVSTYAGSPTIGYQDGAAPNARFRRPSGVAVAADGALYVADTFNHRIRKVGLDGTVSTFAGSGKPAGTDGAPTKASFYAPLGLAFDPTGGLVVADTQSHRIARVALEGTVTTLAGGLGAGLQDGAKTLARFNLPAAVTVLSDGTVYVADTGNQIMRQVSADGLTVTVAGNEAGSIDGGALSARFRNPAGLASDARGRLYVADTDNQAIRLLQ